MNMIQYNTPIIILKFILITLWKVIVVNVNERDLDRLNSRVIFEWLFRKRLFTPVLQMSVNFTTRSHYPSRLTVLIKMPTLCLLTLFETP